MTILMAEAIHSPEVVCLPSMETVMPFFPGMGVPIRAGLLMTMSALGWVRGV